MTLLFVYIGVALGFSFLCSVLEAVLLSITPSYMAKIEQESAKVGSVLRKLKENIDRPLAAILSLNTIAHTVGAAGAGAEANRLWGSELAAIATGVLTLGLLVLSEIIPKSLGAAYWRRLTPFVARTLPWLITMLFPFVWLSQRITAFIKRKDVGGSVSREEFQALALLGVQQGVFDESESRILRNVFEFGELQARDIMTPRTVVFALDESTRVGDAIKERGVEAFSRIPIWKEKIDNISGYVLKDQLLLRAARNELDREIKELSRPALLVPETLLLPALFERLLQEREHIAFVVDEYGGLDGVVTMEDVLETLIGLEIVDEADAVQDMRAMARAKWRARSKKIVSLPPFEDQDAKIE